MKLRLIVGILAVFPSLYAQTAQPDAIPPLMVEFATVGGKPTSLPSMVITHLPVCYSADSCSADFALDMRNRSRQVAAYFDLSGQEHTIDPAAIENLSHVQLLSSTPTADGVAVLLAAAASDNGIGVRIVPKGDTEAPPGHSRPDINSYVCFFDRDGKPRSVHMLDSRYRPVKISYLGADRILLLLFDTINEKPVLALINQDGQIVRILDDQGSLPGGSDLEKNSALKLDDSAPESFKQVAMAGTLTGWQFGRAGNYLLMLKPGTDASIWSLSPGGEIRKIKLKMAPGTTASSLTSSDRAWLVRSFIVASDTGLLLEFDPENGQMLRRIDSKGVPPTSILYAEQGNYYALWWDKDEHPWILKSK